MGGMIFKPAARYPADPRAVFILALSVFSGITALALEVAPNTLEALLPYWAVFLWSFLLALGSLVTLVGMALQTVTGIVLEQVGSVTVGVSAIFYASLALKYGPGADSSQTIGIIFAWGVACLIRWGQLQILIRSAIRRQQKKEVLDRVFSEIEARQKRERHQRDKHDEPHRHWGTF